MSETSEHSNSNHSASDHSTSNHSVDGTPSPAQYPSTGEYSAAERRWLLQLAHHTIRAGVIGRAVDSSASTPATNHLHQPRGAFVTLHENGQLRGCIGSITAYAPLDETVRDMALAAALEDPRFQPVSEDELDRLQLEISVLTPMFAIAPEDVVVGRHGLMISHGGHRGLLLPQVPLEWGWDRETFLAQTCRKAGLPDDQWKKGAKLEAFTAEVFGEATPGESLR
jgi:AmmeMemoRadiSam system protein A